MNKPDLIVFDGDDTLWSVEELYDKARNMAAGIAATKGIDKPTWISLQKEIDLRNFKTMGLSPKRFPQSCAEAYFELAVNGGLEDTANQITKAAQTVFSASARNFPESFEVVSHLSSRLPTVLLTKGDPEVQEKRIKDSELGQLFSTIHIVERKSKDTFLEISRDLKARRPWSVGNSYPSDIKPALEAGYVGIWIDAPVWKHERRSEPTSSDSYTKLESIKQVLDLYQSTCS